MIAIATTSRIYYCIFSYILGFINNLFTYYKVLSSLAELIYIYTVQIHPLEIWLWDGSIFSRPGLPVQPDPATLVDEGPTANVLNMDILIYYCLHWKSLGQGVDTNSGIDYWNGTLDYWNGTLDWTTGLSYFPFL